MKTPQINPSIQRDDERPSLLFSMRFLLAVIIFTGVGMQYMQKIDMGIAIVCMVNATAVKNLENHSHVITNLTGCLFNPETKNTTDGEFVWTKSVQGFILSSYFYGYILTQIPGGWLSMKYGGKLVLGLSMFCGSIATIFSVPVATWSYKGLIFFRFLTGLSHGFMWPAISSMFIKWATPEEKSRLIGFASAGTNIGNIIALPLGGLLCEDGFYHGWGSIFIIFGLMGIIWTAVLAVFTSSSPLEHKFISDKERNYLVRNISSSEMSVNETKSLIGRSRRPSPPWQSMLVSKPCIAIFFAHVCANWGNYLFLTQMPTFMKDVLQFDIKSNGFYSSIPYICCLTFAGTSSLLADKLIVAKTLPRSTVRKIFNSTGLFVPMILVICLSFVTCAHPYLGVFLLGLGVGFLGCCTGAGYQVNMNEIGGCYSGVLLSISNTFATLSGIVAPYIVGLLTPNGTADEWKIVFYITAVVYIVGGSVYAAFSSSDIQKWAFVEDENEENEKYF